MPPLVRWLLGGQAPAAPKLNARLLRSPSLLSLPCLAHTCSYAATSAHPPACLLHARFADAPGMYTHWCPRGVLPTNRSTLPSSPVDQTLLSPPVSLGSPCFITNYPCEEICGRWCAAVAAVFLILGPRRSERSTFLSLACMPTAAVSPPHLPPHPSLPSLALISTTAVTHSPLPSSPCICLL
jgi:hypothetical protein